MDMFSQFFDGFGIDSSNDQDLQGPKQEQIQGQGSQTQKIISQTNIYDMYCESHINLGICQMKQGGTQKLKDSVVTFTSILKYISE